MNGQIAVPQYQVINGDSADMDVLGDGEVELVLTSPPYFSESTEGLLLAPRKDQIHVERVRHEVLEFAAGLDRIFRETCRVLKTDGTLAIQTKDVRYGGFLIPLVARHRMLIEDHGLRCIAHVICRRIRRNAPPQEFLRKPRVGAYRGDDFEEILVFKRSLEACHALGQVDLSASELKNLAEPYWTVAPVGQARIHPHQMPAVIATRIVALFSKPGDLVVDPFCGSGTTLKAAVEMGRRAVGYELDPAYSSLIDYRMGVTTHG